MDRTTITCTDTEQTMGADILDKNDRRLTVAIDETYIKIVLYKDTPTQRVYVGKKSGLEFTSTGD